MVDVDGRPIQGVNSSPWSTTDSDAEGRFFIGATREEWNQRQKRTVSLCAMRYHWLEVPLGSFSPDRESVFALERAEPIRGQVFDESGKPLEDCEVQLNHETVPGPHKDGKWESYSGGFAWDTLRISVGGSVRSVREFTLKEGDRGPIITKLGEGHRLTGRLVARVPLDEKNTPVAVLRGPGDKEPGEHAPMQQAQVQADGSFAFCTLADGKYTLQLHPAACSEHRAGQMNPGVGAYSVFWDPDANKPWEKSLTIQGRDVQLDPINLHEAGVLPGRLTGVAYQDVAEPRPLANVFGYICDGEGTYNTVGGFYYRLRFMTDAEGRFRVDHCPPGKYSLHLTESTAGYGSLDQSVWIRVAPEKTAELRLFRRKLPGDWRSSSSWAMARRGTFTPAPLSTQMWLRNILIPRRERQRTSRTRANLFASSLRRSPSGWSPSTGPGPTGLVITRDMSSAHAICLRPIRATSSFRTSRRAAGD